MPKQLHKIDSFHGGLNSNADPRDILDNEFASAKEAMVDSLGRVTMMGGSDTLTTTSSINCGIIAGKGLFSFSSDYNGADNAAVTVSNGRATPTSSDYIAFMDADADGKVAIYNATTDNWSGGTAAVDLLGNQGSVEADFYYVDGALRVSDGNFANKDNNNMWYSLIDRTLFPDVTSYVIAADWYSVPQKVLKPRPDCRLQTAIASSGLTAATRKTTTGLTVTTNHFQIDDGSIGSGSGAAQVNIAELVITWTAVSTSGDMNYYGEATIKAGRTTSDSTSAYTSNKESIVSFESYDSTNTDTGTTTMTFLHDPADIPITGDGTDGVMVEIKEKEEYGNGTFRITGVVYKNLSGTAVPHSTLTTENVAPEIVFATPDEGSAVGWGSGSSPNGFYWNAGVSFIYDENQESLIRECVDSGNDIFVMEAIDGQSPEIKFNIEYTSSWNPRITGAKIYMRKVQGDTYSSWHPQIVYDFVSGKCKVYLTGHEETVQYDAVGTGEHNWQVSKNSLLQPNLADTYESETGISEEETSIISKRRVSTVAGRQVYIGGVEVEYDDGTQSKILSDTMIKSIPGKFDLFPLQNRVEVEINDGDDITALESFADRILQFKKQNLFIINVSQNIEFLEGTYSFKGVESSCSVTKTDYGVAWANVHGCYLYDGTTVHNLLEKKGRKIIDDDEWDYFLRSSKNDSPVGSFTAACERLNADATVIPGTVSSPVANSQIQVGQIVTGTSIPANTQVISVNTEGAVTSFEMSANAAGASTSTLTFTTKRLIPMVGYIPKKRQLMIFHDKGNGGGSNGIGHVCYIYDLSTGAWTVGAENTTHRIVNLTKTNFTNDADGNLIYGFLSGSDNLIKKWNPSQSQAQSLDLQTKNMDFGHPGLRKKIYKIYVTHKGAGSNTTKIQYRTNLSTGEQTAWTDLTSPTDGIFGNYTGWRTQEFKTPSTASDWNNVYSIQLRILPKTGNPAGTFQINDISIVYRPKNVK